jgi:hypothetical protein
LTTWHAVFIQVSIYRDGVCQNNFLTGLDTAMVAAVRRGEVVKTVRFEPGTMSYIGSRSIFGRRQYAGIRFAVLPAATTPGRGELLMDAQCRVH